MEKKIEFANKVNVKRKKRGVEVGRKIVTVLCVLLILVSLLQGNGLRGATTGVIGILFANLSQMPSKKEKESGEYITALAEMEIDGNNFILKNKSIDKNDGFGERDETYTFLLNKITNIYFSQELVSLCVKGEGTLRLTWISGKNKGKSDKVKNTTQCYIYSRREQIDEMIQALENATGKKVQVVQ